MTWTMKNGKLQIKITGKWKKAFKYPQRRNVINTLHNFIDHDGFFLVGGGG